ncbi:hypothetical protein MNB_SUP05-SYMBIONT-4-1325 [hydrothermal vent metagenome]|uniref:Uncharacterized protein n=1 Tax=hydrothermal vent metagenome TaxID=652676 RepID=A0A1W1DXT8_9ZZZZ
MLHNHFIVFDKQQLKDAPLTDINNPNLTDGGQHSVFSAYMKDVYMEFMSSLDLKILKPTIGQSAGLALTGYPQGLTSWEIQGGIESLKSIDFWHEYDQILKGFLDFYRAFFAQVSSRNSGVPKKAYYPKEIERTLLFNNNFLSAAKKVREKCLNDAKYASGMRWQPAFKQLIYRDSNGRLIVVISQNSIGNAITELLGVVVKREPNAEAYEKAEPALIDKLLQVRSRLVEADLGHGIATKYWDK